MFFLGVVLRSDLPMWLDVGIISYGSSGVIIAPFPSNPADNSLYLGRFAFLILSQWVFQNSIRLDFLREIFDFQAVLEVAGKAFCECFDQVCFHVSVRFVLSGCGSFAMAALNLMLRDINLQALNVDLCSVSY